MVAVIVFMLHVVLVSLGCAVHLFEESRIFRIAVRIVRATQAHRRLVLEVARVGGGEQMLLLLQYGEQHFLAYPAGLA